MPPPARAQSIAPPRSSTRDKRRASNPEAALTARQKRPHTTTARPNAKRTKPSQRNADSFTAQSEIGTAPQTPAKHRHPKIPLNPAEKQADEANWRFTSCALCPGYKPLTRKQVRDPKTQKYKLGANSAMLQKVKQIFSDYRTNKVGVPEALCPSHGTSVAFHHSGKKRKFSQSFIAEKNKRFRGAKSGYRTTKGSTPLSNQHSESLTSPKYPLANILENLSGALSSDDDAPEQHSPLNVLKTPPTKRPRGKSKKTKCTPELKPKHMVKAGATSNLTGRKLSKFTESLRTQGDKGDYSIRVTAGESARKVRSDLNKVFQDDFINIPTNLCPDNGAAQVCKDTVDFLRKVVFIRGKHADDVVLAKANLDGGRGSQKLMIQLMFSEDPIFDLNSTDKDRAAYAAENGGFKDNGVKHTLILGLIKGGKENHEVTKFLYDRLVEDNLLKKAFPNSSTFLPNDLKQQNLVCGVGTHSSRNPLHSDTWSKWPEHSRPKTLRTGNSILTDFNERENARMQHKDSSAKHFNSVEARPIDILLNRGSTPVGDTCCPCPLHLNLGMASHTVECVEKLDHDLCKAWERALGVTREKKRGGKPSFVGNDARKILSEEGADELKRLIDQKAAGLHSSAWFTHTQPVLHLIVAVIRGYDTFIVRTMKLHLHPRWEEGVQEFVTAYGVFAKAYTLLFPRSRSDELMTPKIAYIKHEVVRWIKKFKLSLMVITEQAFEAVHYQFLEKEKSYSIPRTGEELLAGERRFTSDAAFGRKRKGKTRETGAAQTISSETTTESTESAGSSEVLQDKTTQQIHRARDLMKDAVAAFNAENVLACGDGCYERMREVNKFLSSGEDLKFAPWRPQPAKRKRKRKGTPGYTDDEDWKM